MRRSSENQRSWFRSLTLDVHQNVMQPRALIVRRFPMGDEHPDLSPSAAQPCCDSPLDIEQVLSPASPDPSGRGFLRLSLCMSEYWREQYWGGQNKESNFHCPVCEYTLQDLPDQQCPECGFMFHRIGLDEMPMFRDAVYTERFSARLASVVCVVFSVLLLLAIPFIFLTGLFLGGWHVVVRAKSALFLSSIVILALLVFYVVAGAAIWSSRRSIPVRLMRVYPNQRSTWTSKLAYAVVGVSLLIVSYVVLNIS